MCPRVFSGLFRFTQREYGSPGAFLFTWAHLARLVVTGSFWFVWVHSEGPRCRRVHSVSRVFIRATFVSPGSFGFVSQEHRAARVSGFIRVGVGSLWRAYWPPRLIGFA